MQTKLTLRIEDTLIKQAKSYAKKSGKSLSKIVADYFTLLNKNEILEHDSELTPLVRSLKGILGSSQASIEDYKRYLEDKYL